MLALAERTDTKNIRSYVFAPPRYGTEGYFGGIYKLLPDVTKIRAAVHQALTSSPAAQAQREKLSNEATSVWVLNGSGKSGQANDIASYLEYQGIDATAPNQKPDTSGLAATKIVVYNGAETELTDTIDYLQKLFKVTVTNAVDPNVHVQIVITTAASTPTLTPPPAP